MASKKTIIIISLVSVGLITAGVLLYFKYRKPQDEPLVDEDESKGEAPKNITPKVVVLPVEITNDTVLEWTSPSMKGDRVKWVQNTFNRLAKKHNEKHSEKWALLTEDGSFGSQTHKALPKILGASQHKTSWNNFKKKAIAWNAKYYPKTGIWSDSEKSELTAGGGGSW